MQLKVTVTYDTTAVPSQTKPGIGLFLHGALLRARKVHLLPVCAGAVHSVCSLPSDHTLNFPWVAVERIDRDGHCVGDTLQC